MHKANSENPISSEKTSALSQVWSIILRYKIILIILLILLIDQLVKVWIKTSMHPHETSPIIDGFFQLYYIENRGMAFGTTLGAGAGPKYALSIFRLIAIIAIGYYLYKNIRDTRVSRGLVIAMALIFAGATGNLIDGMFYDYIFEIDPNVAWNWAIDSNENFVLDEFGNPVLRPNGFFLGSVVDMFQFTVTWPSWMPFNLAGKEVFGAIWNIADLAISTGVGLIIVRYRSFFRKPEPVVELDDSDQSSSGTSASDQPEN